MLNFSFVQQFSVSTWQGAFQGMTQGSGLVLPPAPSSGGLQDPCGRRESVEKQRWLLKDFGTEVTHGTHRWFGWWSPLGGQQFIPAASLYCGREHGSLGNVPLMQSWIIVSPPTHTHTDTYRHIDTHRRQPHTHTQTADYLKLREYWLEFKVLETGLQKSGRIILISSGYN